MFFFFQAEDGIRDFHVTGVQTCALPIWPAAAAGGGVERVPGLRVVHRVGVAGTRGGRVADGDLPGLGEIGRASCRERVQVSVFAESLRRKRQEERTDKNTQDSKVVDDGI